MTDTPPPTSVPLRELGFSLVRTITPYVVPRIVAHWAFDADDLSLFIDGGLAVAYYSAVRWLEMKVNPRLGWLLGVPRSPSYA